MGLEIKLEKVSKKVLCYQVYRQDDHKKSVNHASIKLPKIEKLTIVSINNFLSEFDAKNKEMHSISIFLLCLIFKAGKCTVSKCTKHIIINNNCNYCQLWV